MIGRALKLIRTYHDLTQSELARQLGVSNSHISEVESEKKNPTIELLQKYSSNFDIPLSSILFFSESLENKVVENLRMSLARKVVAILEWNESRYAAKEEKRKEKLSA